MRPVSEPTQTFKVCVSSGPIKPIGHNEAIAQRPARGQHMIFWREGPPWSETYGYVVRTVSETREYDKLIPAEGKSWDEMSEAIGQLIDECRAADHALLIHTESRHLGNDAAAICKTALNGIEQFQRFDHNDHTSYFPMDGSSQDTTNADAA